MSVALRVSLLVAGAVGAASATFPVSDTDLYWHLATARETLARGIVRTDIFSWSAVGAPVAADQWLGQLLLYAGYGLGSWQGVIAVRTIAVALLVGLISAAALLRRPSSPVVALAVAVPAILLSRSLWTERPELFGAAFLAALVLLLQLRGERPLFAIAPLIVLWANVHGSFALGSGLVLLVCGRGLIADPPLRRGYAVAVAGALASFVLTPAGPGTLAIPGLHLLGPPREIQEWAIPSPTTPAGGLWALVLAAVLATAALAHGARARDVILVVPTALLSLIAIRYAPLFAIAATPYLAERLPLAVRLIRRAAAGDEASPAVADASEKGGLTLAERRTARSAAGPPASSERARPPSLVRTRGRQPFEAAIALISGALLVASIALAPREVDEAAFPVGALEALPRGPGVLSEYDWGGWLIWRAPATPVFVDGRLVPYRGQVLGDYVSVVEAPPGWRDVLERRGIRWLLVRPSRPVAVRAQDLGWRVLSRSPYYVLIEVGGR